MRRKWIVMIVCLAALSVGSYYVITEGIFSTGKGSGPDGIIEVGGPESRDDIPTLARKAPVELLYKCLQMYKEQKIEGYTCTLVKQERINGNLNPQETIEVWFRENPYSVMMHWKEGAGEASASLFVNKENDGKMCVRPKRKAAAMLFPIVKKMTDCDEAKATSRYLITEFGLRCGTERTWKAWKALKEKGNKLDITPPQFESNVAKAGGRDCYIIVRHCNPPEDDGMKKITLYIDAETWQQVGTVLEDDKGIIGSYFFKDIKINPEFDSAQFKPETLKKY